MRNRIALFAALLTLAATGSASANEYWVQGTGKVAAAEDKETAYLYAYQDAIKNADQKCQGGFTSDATVTSQKIEYQTAQGVPAWTGTVSIRELCHADNG